MLSDDSFVVPAPAEYSDHFMAQTRELEAAAAGGDIVVDPADPCSNAIASYYMCIYRESIV